MASVLRRFGILGGRLLVACCTASAGLSVLLALHAHPPLLHLLSATSPERKAKLTAIAAAVAIDLLISHVWCGPALTEPGRGAALREGAGAAVIAAAGAMTNLAAVNSGASPGALLVAYASAVWVTFATASLLLLLTPSQLQRASVSDRAIKLLRLMASAMAWEYVILGLALTRFSSGGSTVAGDDVGNNSCVLKP